MSTALLPDKPVSIPALGAAQARSLWHIEPAGDKAVIVRSATAGTIEPADWRERLTSCLQVSANVVLVGAKRVDPTGQALFSMGEMIIHPKGFHHLGKGLAARAYRWPEEVDLVCGGVFAVDRQWFEQVKGPIMLSGQLGAVMLGLLLRHAGGRCITTPSVVVADTFTPVPSPEDAAIFQKIFAFDWRAPDLDDVRQRFAHSGLLWNVRFHTPTMPFDKYEYRPALVWQSYQDAEVFRQRAHHLANCVRNISNGGPVLEIGSGDGLFSHLFATTGLEVVGIDPEALGVEQARAQTAKHTYTGPRPRFEVGNGSSLPFPDGSFAAACIIDVIEHLPNPVRVLREAARILRPGGKLMIVTPTWQFGTSSDPAYHNFEYTAEELVAQVNTIPGLTVTNTGEIGAPYRDAIVIAQKAAA